MSIVVVKHQIDEGVDNHTAKQRRGPAPAAPPGDCGSQAQQGDGIEEIEEELPAGVMIGS